jgi:hypothetical protein
MISRRFIAAPEGPRRRMVPTLVCAQEGVRWEVWMSALGHKRTCAAQNVMSALAPIATVEADSSKRSCPLCPRKRTCAVQ